jgi:hypothetical protein
LDKLIPEEKIEGKVTVLTEENNQIYFNSENPKK